MTYPRHIRDSKLSVRARTTAKKFDVKHNIVEPKKLVVHVSFIKSYFGKIGEQVTKDDIEEFIRKKFEESKNLDYKQIDILSDIKSGIKKLCKHICAFANSEGGLLLLGVSEQKESNRIYPDKITWRDPSYTKEQLENVLLGNISPHIDLDIQPIRKSQTDLSVIFLIDVPKSNELHMTNDRFYKRVNFQSLPMSHNEIVFFIRERLKFDECAMFRFQLREFILELFDEALCRLLQYTFEERKQAKEDIEQTIQKLVGNWNEINEKIFAKTPIINIINFADHIETMYKKDVKLVKRYPHDEVTPEEKILFIELEELMNDFGISYLRAFFLNDAEAHGITGDWRDSSLQFEIKTQHGNHVRSIVEGDLSHLRILLENFLKILKKFSLLEARYGLLRESSAVKCYFD